MSLFQEPKRHTAINDTTGDLIKSRADAQDKYSAGWDLIFNAKKVKDVSVAAFNEQCCGKCGSCGKHIDNEQ